MTLNQLGEAQMPKWFDELDQKIARGMDKFGRLMLRISLAIVFIWFGILKLLDLSPAAELVARTVYWIPADVFVPILGWWEVAIGICLLFRPLIRIALMLLFLQMPGTMLPLVLVPDACYTQFPFGLTLEGQYIIKNLIIIGAAIVVGGTVRQKSEKVALL